MHATGPRHTEDNRMRGGEIRIFRGESMLKRILWVAIVIVAFGAGY